MADHSLAEGNPEPANDSVDITPELKVEDFDLDEFVAGARKSRRAVTITSRPDLVAELDKIAARAADLPEDDEESAQNLLDEYEDLRLQIKASQRIFVVEARSLHRARQIQKQLEKRGITEPGKKATEEDVRDYNETLAYHRLADGIVIPSGVTPETLQAMAEVLEPEVNKLLGAFQAANEKAPGREIDIPFSRRR